MGERWGAAIGWSPAVGGVLGFASFAADLLDGDLRTVLQLAASTGFAWGYAAFVAAFPARSRRTAVAAAVVVLATATVCYYALNLASDRWRAQGLLPVLTAMAYWLLLSVVGGAVLGVLAHLVRSDRPPVAATAAGLACGLLAGAGIQIVADHFVTGDFGGMALAEGFAQAFAGVAVTVWMFGRGRGPRSWPRFAAVACVACAAAALAWDAVESVQVAGF
ncbi:DUF6518 family protein [Dactylosporangium sp. NPDC000521]|uniref:DUF6518 family protein n=1 Tax=Dactylosporangium sp. NPDC000521 TaxID=3363975 RepID=UPI00367AD13E